MSVWIKYPEEKPRNTGHYFVTYKREDKIEVRLDKFISSAIFACEIYGWQVIAWAPITIPAPDPEIVSAAEKEA